MSVQPPRRLSARRGSSTAPDPFGIHSDLNLNPNRSSSSRLTIVRVPAAPNANPTPLSLNDPPSSPVLGQRRLHRRVAPPAAPPERVSFAFSSFDRSASGRDSPDHALSSPSSSPRLRPSSPHLSASNPYGTKPRLTPDQLVSLARHSTVPRPSNDPVSPPVVAQPAPATFTPLPDDIYLPFIDRPAEVSALISTPPDLKLFSLLAQTYRNKLSDSPETPPQSQEHIHLPPDPANWSYAHLLFHLTRVDRDVAPDFIWAIAARKSILSHSELLWERIKGALGVPPELDVDYNFLDEDQESPDTSDISDDEGRAARGHWSDWDDVIDSPVHARKRLSMGDSPANSIYIGSKKDDQFKAQVDDRLAGLQAGFTRSSNTINDAENETEGGDTTTTISPTPHGFASPPDQDQEVGGMVIGHFSPPIFAENPSIAEQVSIEPLLAPPTSGTSPGVLFNSLSVSSIAGGSAPVPVPGEAGGGLGLGDIAEGAEEEEEENDHEGVEIEVDSTTVAVVEEAAAQEAAAEDPDLISPSQIQGLRISTSPHPPAVLPPSGSSAFPHITSTSPVMSPISPVHPQAHPNFSTTANVNANTTATVTGTQSQSHAQAIAIPTSSNVNAHAHSHSSSSSSQPHSRRSSFGSLGPFQRSESTGNLSASWGAMAAAAAAAGNGGGLYGYGNLGASGQGQSQSQGNNNNNNYASSVIGSDAGDSSTGYISDGDVRFAYGGGQPLFVSNFARLAGGPTLRANTSSSKRHSSHVPHVRYAVDSLALHMRNSSTGSASSASANAASGTQQKIRTYSHGASSRPTSFSGSTGGTGGASLGRVASLGGGSAGTRGVQGPGMSGGILSSSSSSLSSLGGGGGGGGNPNRKSWGETKAAGKE